MTSSNNTRSRGWAVTINNYTQDDLDHFEDQSNMAHYQYACYGKEVGKQGTPHLQCYFYFNQKISFKKMKKAWPHAHIEPARSSPIVNINYCKKDGKFKEFGTRPEQGRRSDLEIIKTHLDNNEYNFVRRNYFSQWCQYRRAFNDYIKEEYLMKQHKYDVERYDSAKEAIQTLSYDERSVTFIDFIHCVHQPTQTIIVIHKLSSLSRQIDLGVQLQLDGHQVFPTKILIYGIKQQDIYEKIN